MYICGIETKIAISILQFLEMLSKLMGLRNSLFSRFQLKRHVSFESPTGEGTLVHIRLGIMTLQVQFVVFDRLSLQGASNQKHVLGLLWGPKLPIFGL